MKNTLALFTTLALIFHFNNSNAQLFGNKKTGKKSIVEEITQAANIKKLTKSSKLYSGLFPIYQDSTNGKTYLEINKKQLNKEFIYFSYVENGVVDASLFKGSYRGSKIIKFQKRFNTIEIVAPNTHFYFDPENPISKSADANINTPILVSETILGETDSTYLIDSKALFLSENLTQIKPNYPKDWKGLKLGKLNETKSKTISIRNYPKNTDVRAIYVYENVGENAKTTSDNTDGRFISITYHHSLMEVPENDFKPRYDDPRVGYFMTQVTDLTSASPTPYRDIIHRWNLVKNNPNAELSEPVEPIVWWIENTTPYELRPIIKEGVEAWNSSFEKIGFKNAMVVKIQPDTATWDAGDIRYNVLRWTSSPKPPFGGYGPSFVNPRTGQILGADIMLEYVYVLGRLRQKKYFNIESALEDLNNHDMHKCSAGAIMQEQVLFGKSALVINNLTDIEFNTFLVQSIKRLVLHEVGHTLGLNHNMKGSTIQSVEDLKNKAKIDEEGMCNSVMEYPAINFALDKKTQTNYYDYKPGFYDDWAIDFGYSVALNDEKKETERLNKILAKSTNPKLVFGNDADDMRSPGKGIDPMVNIYDLSNDPVAYGVERITLVNDSLMPKILDKFSIENQSYAELKDAFNVLLREKAIQLNIFTRQIGGVYVNRAFVGQETNTAPYTPVPLAKQKAAMDALAKYAFAPDAFNIDSKLITHLQTQRRGFNFFSKAEDPKLHDVVLTIHQGLLQHLLHENVLKRIIDSELYGNEYKLDVYLSDLTSAIFDADKNGSINHYRQNLQLAYTNKLIKYLESKSALESSKSLVLAQLLSIQKLAKSQSGDATSKAHKEHLSLIIDKALKI